MRRTTSPPPPAADELDAQRLVLRDGSVASVRSASTTDREALRHFFQDLSPESRRNRFFAAGAAPDTVVDSLCDSSDPSRAFTLLVCRQLDDTVRIIAAASYIAVTDGTAEVAFAVDDRFQAQGIGTLLLEQLAARASVSGFHRFYATTLAENDAMRGVFRDSGFEIRSKSAGGVIEVQLSLTPSFEGVAAAERRRHEAVVASLRPLLAPRAVAVIGASRDPRKIGSRILRAITDAGFPRPVHIVHPEATSLLGIAAVRSARELPPGVDLAIVAVPPHAVSAVVDDCAASGVKALVVITAGFAETGGEGLARQNALVEKVRGYGMRMVGPNCMGLLTPATRLNASFSPIVPSAGRVALSSQSGALGVAILGLAAEREVGLSAFVSVGNKADVSSNDLLEFWEDDPATRVILLYLESFGNPRRFARLGRRIALVKPIVAIKAGRTKAGSRAAGSHTAALAASDTAADALFHQSGVIRAQTIDEMFDIAACLHLQPLPNGGRVAIVTNAGGPAILAADACEGAGLAVAEFSAATRARLAAFLPPTAAVANPVDMIASAGRDGYSRAVASVLGAPEVDALVIIYTPVDPAESGGILDGIREGVETARAEGAVDKPVLACVMPSSLKKIQLRSGAESIPVYSFPENAAHALGKIAAYARWRAQPAGLRWGFEDIHSDWARSIVRHAVAAAAENGDGGSGDGVWLKAQDTYALLHAYGIPAAASTLARSAEEAAALASVVGFPVVAKIASARLPHKTDIGGVRVNLTSGTDVRRAYADIVANVGRLMPDSPIDGVLIQPMVAGGIETIIGIAHDPVFGPLIGFGIGGIDVELLGDVRFRVAPLTDRDADELLHEIRGFPVLQGYRGRAAADLDALRDILLRVSRLAEDHSEIAELDLNPVMALEPGKGCRVVDARVRVAQQEHDAARPVARLGISLLLIVA